jgi:hypothetical protein
MNPYFLAVLLVIGCAIDGILLFYFRMRSKRGRE